MSEISYQTLKSLALLLRAFRGMSLAEAQCLEYPYSCLIWAGGMEWNVELVPLEQDKDSLLLGFSAQEMSEASWANLFKRQLEVNRTLHICDSPVAAELALSPQLHSLTNQYNVMRDSLQRFLIRVGYAIESLEQHWQQAQDAEREWELQKLERFEELLSLIHTHLAHMQELEQGYIKLSKTSGLAPRLPSIEEEGQRQSISIKLQQLLSSKLAQHASFNPTNSQALVERLRLSI